MADEEAQIMGNLCSELSELTNGFKKRKEAFDLQLTKESGASNLTGVLNDLSLALSSVMGVADATKDSLEISTLYTQQVLFEVQPLKHQPLETNLSEKLDKVITRLADSSAKCHALSIELKRIPMADEAGRKGQHVVIQDAGRDTVDHANELQVVYDAFLKELVPDEEDDEEE